MCNEPVQEPCDCYESSCNECNQRIDDEQRTNELNDHYYELERQEDARLIEELEGGDDDDWDEEDLHGSHPIDDPDIPEEDDGDNH